MKILVVAVNFVKIPYQVYPLGAGIIAALARERGHRVRLLDLLSACAFGRYDPRILKEALKEFQPDCVGLSLRNLESAESANASEHWSLDLLRRIVSDIRAVTSAPQVIGGAGFSLMPETALQYSGADYGLAGEGEEIWPAFLEALAAGRAEKGLWARAAHPAAEQKSAYDPDLVRLYAKEGGLIGVQSKRGCPLKCLYCSYPLLEGRSIRPRPVAEVLEDLRFLAGLMDEPHLAFTDAVFNDPDGHWRELLAAMAAARLKLKWTAFFQPAEFEKDDWRLLRAAGVSGLEFGADGSNDAALSGLAKPFDFALVQRIQEQCLAHEIPAAHYFVFGGPNESRATVEEGIININSLKGCVAFISSGLSMYPNTPLAELAMREGLIRSEKDIVKPLYYYSPALDPAWLHRRLLAAFGPMRDRLYPPSAAFEHSQALRRMGYRGILWDTLIGTGQRKAGAANG